jgi:hypothetical protein
MGIDWNEVKKMTLWNYEELMEKILQVFSYNCVLENYNHSMEEAEDYAASLLCYHSKHAESLNRLMGFFKSARAILMLMVLVLVLVVLGL